VKDIACRCRFLHTQDVWGNYATNPNKIGAPPEAGLRRIRRGKKFAVCIWNKDYEGDLELYKTYEQLPDPRAECDGLIRIIDESGEDYFYPADWFCPPGKERLYSSRRIRHSRYLENF
jgi:hypothetical protein